MTLQVIGYCLFRKWLLFTIYEHALFVEQTLDGSVVIASLPYITV